MTRRFAGVLSTGSVATRAAAPPGVDPDELRLAMLEDTYELVAGLELVTTVLVLSPPEQPAAEAITWPGTPILRLADYLPGGDRTLAALTGLHGLGADQAVVVAADAPDLPPLLIGKLFRALGNGDAAVCPAADGGLVALAVRLPLPDWLADARPDLDAPEAVTDLRAAAPRPRAVRSGPGWHRLREPADLARLDPGLEGWENTRALLSASSQVP